MIHLDRDGTTAVLTLQRVDRGNALNLELVEALIRSVEACAADPSVNTLVLTGEGPDFCTGFDLGGLAQAGDFAGLDAMDGTLLWRFVRIEHLLATLWHAPVRTVAVARGRAFGAGADLFAACDIRLAAPGTQWRFPGAAFGIVLGTRRLAEQVGSDCAMAWVTTGATVTADEALARGLMSGITPDGTWREQVTPLTVDQTTLAALRQATHADLRDADLAALVRSASRPGLARRIAAYRDAMRSAAVIKPRPGA